MIKRVKELRPEAEIASSKFRDFLEKFESEINRGISTLCVLSIINSHGKEGIYGYKILKELEEKTNDMLIVEEGTLYPLLRKLEKRDKLINSAKKVVEGRMRKYYIMNENGRKIYFHISGYYNKLMEAISSLVDIKVHLKERYFYCPNCSNKIDLSNEDVFYCEICGYNLQDIKKRRLEK
ncbi:MAG: PadR family transcriptional regulator [Candidatus Lokiarchaeota archaeon]